MRRIFLLAGGLLLAGATAQAQDHRPFSPGRTYHYQEAQGSGKSRVYLFRVDSVYAQGADTVFCFNGPPYVVAPGPAVRHNLFGARFRWNAPTGQATFYGHAGTDTVRLLTRAGVGQTWNFNRTISATLTSRQAGNVLGQPDTVLTISLSDGQTLRCSRRYGIIEGVGFFGYLGSQYISSYYAPASVALAGIPELQLGTLNISGLTIHDRRVGDRFYYQGTTRTPAGNPPVQCTATWAREEVIAVAANGDSLLLDIVSASGVCGGGLTPGAHTRAWVRQDRTDRYGTAEWISPYEFFRIAPAIIEPDTLNGRPRVQSTHLLTFGRSSVYTVAVGLGEVVNASNGGTVYPSSYRRLVGYVKGAEVWGDTTSLRPTAVADDIRRLPATLAPNPSSDEAAPRLIFSPDGPQTATLVLYDGLGREIWRQQPALTAGEQRLPIGPRALAPGLYRLRLTLADGRQRVLPLVRQ